MKKTSVLHVLMNGILVGDLIKTSNGALAFTYDESWLNTIGARPISLSLPLASKTFKGEEVYNFFENLLPDNQAIRSRIQARFHVATSHPFDLLAQVARDCIGALQLSADYPKFNENITYKSLTDGKMADILSNYQFYPLGMTADVEDFRISIAGAQEKAAFLFYKNKWNIPLSDTPTTHIFKLPIGMIRHQNMDLSDSCENEWLCTQIAAAFELPVAPCEILNFNNMKVLAVERFDRKLSQNKKWIVRLPQEDLCQALGYSSQLKYQADGGPGIEEIMQFLLGAKDPLQNRDFFFRAQILFWLLAAIDGHAKNFSIFIEPEGRFTLTPLYDILSAYPMIAKKQLQKQKIKMAMALKAKNMHYHWYTVQRRHFLEQAKGANYPVERAQMILDDMLSKVELVIDKVSKMLPKAFPEVIATSIFEGMLAMKSKLENEL